MDIPHYDNSIYTCAEQTPSHTHSPAVIPHGNPHSLILQIFPLSQCQAPRQEVLISHAETTHSLSALHVPSVPQSRKRGKLKYYSGLYACLREYNGTPDFTQPRIRLRPRQRGASTPPKGTAHVTSRLTNLHQTLKQPPSIPTFTQHSR